MQKLEPNLLAVLRDQIGCRGNHQNQEYELIEVLEHDNALVLLDCSNANTIQSDMHGEAHRIVSKTHTVPIFSEVGAGFHPVLTEFFANDLLAALQKLIKSDSTS